MSKIQQRTEGLAPTLEFTAGNNTTGTIGMDNDGFKFEGQVSQKHIITKTCAATMLINAREGNIFTITLTEDITDFDVVNAGIGTYIFKFLQDGTGAWGVTFDSKFKFEASAGDPDFTGDAAGVTNIVSCFFDGTSFWSTYMLNLS